MTKHRIVDAMAAQPTCKRCGETAADCVCRRDTPDCPVNANGYHSPLIYKGVNQGRVLYACGACGRVREIT